MVLDPPAAGQALVTLEIKQLAQAADEADATHVFEPPLTAGTMEYVVVRDPATVSHVSVMV